MKRVAIGLLIFILMTVSFAAVSMLIVYVSGTATSVEEVEKLFSDEMAAPSALRSNEDGLGLLDIQISEITGEIGRMERRLDTLKSLADSLARANSKNEMANE